MKSFLLIGQSNMAGRGFIKDAKPIDASHISTFRNGVWFGMFRPINPDRPHAGVCLAESFAEAYAKKYDERIGLIPCASGNTKLSQWMPGTNLYDNAVHCAKLAMRSSELLGILWHQGESDVSSDETINNYKENFEIMINTMRKELGNEELPVVIGGLGDYLKEDPDYTPEAIVNVDRLNEIFEDIVKTNKKMAFASAKGLTCNPDLTHFNAESLYDFGLRYFEAFETI